MPLGLEGAACGKLAAHERASGRITCALRLARGSASGAQVCNSWRPPKWLSARRLLAVWWPFGRRGHWLPLVAAGEAPLWSQRGSCKLLQLCESHTWRARGLGSGGRLRRLCSGPGASLLARPPAPLVPAHWRPAERPLIKLSPLQFPNWRPAILRHYKSC